MCTLGFQGKGYSLGFIKNYKNIVKILHENEDTLIEVVEYMDDICSPCPNRQDNVVCKTQDKILRLDQAHLKILGLTLGQIISWKEAKEQIRKHMTLEKFDQACTGCEWKKYGVCADSLQTLLNK